MLLVELKATADLDQQHSLYSPKTYNLVYNNNVILLLYYWIPELAGTIAVFSKEGGAGYLTPSLKQDLCWKKRF